MKRELSSIDSAGHAGERTVTCQRDFELDRGIEEMKSLKCAKRK